MEETKTSRHDHKGENNPFYGKTHSEETKQAISEKQRWNSEMLKEILEKVNSMDVDEMAEIVTQKVEEILKNNGLVICQEVEVEDDEQEGGY